jgi:hypothetical protein
VHAAREPLLVGDPKKKRMELRPLVLVEGGTQRCVVLASNSTDGFEGLPPLRRQVKSVAPAIVGAVAALHEAKSFKLVHKEGAPPSNENP